MKSVGFQTRNREDVWMLGISEIVNTDEVSWSLGTEQRGRFIYLSDWRCYKNYKGYIYNKALKSVSLHTLLIEPTLQASRTIPHKPQSQKQLVPMAPTDNDEGEEQIGSDDDDNDEKKEEKSGKKRFI